MIYLFIFIIYDILELQVSATKEFKYNPLLPRSPRLRLLVPHNGGFVSSRQQSGRGPVLRAYGLPP